MLRSEIEITGQAVIHIDLAPDWTQQRLVEALSKSQGSRSISHHLERTIGFKGVKVGLLHEVFPKSVFHEPNQLALSIKSIPITLLSPRPLVEAISTAGGVDFSALDERLMVKTLPGIFCAGEMLDWEAPTGGYLLTACLATGRAAGLGAHAWIER
jgi:hypothetical protein